MQPTQIVVKLPSGTYAIDFLPPVKAPSDSPPSVMQMLGGMVLMQRVQEKPEIDTSKVRLNIYPTTWNEGEVIDSFFGTDHISGEKFYWYAMGDYNLATQDILISGIVIVGATDLAKAMRGKVIHELNYHVANRIKEVVAKGMTPKKCKEFFDQYELLSTEIGSSLTQR